MELKRFFASADDFDGKYITIEGEEFTHMTKVLRHKIGYKIIVNLDDGKDYYCAITQIEKDRAKALVEDVKDNERKSRVSVTLFQALPKGDKFDLITQKCVELGAEEIIPFTSAYTNETKFNAARANRIAIEACKQCGRARKARVGELLNFEEMIDSLCNYDTVVFPYERAVKGSVKDIIGMGEGRKIAVIIGSEGGFSAEEAQAIESRRGQTISLGSRILRCETAAIVTLSLIMYEMGELQGK